MVILFDCLYMISLIHCHIYELVQLTHIVLFIEHCLNAMCLLGNGTCERNRDPNHLSCFGRNFRFEKLITLSQVRLEQVAYIVIYASFFTF